jgi:hypothetical protein
LQLFYLYSHWWKKMTSWRLPIFYILVGRLPLLILITRCNY